MNKTEIAIEKSRSKIRPFYRAKRGGFAMSKIDFCLGEYCSAHAITRGKYFDRLGISRQMWFLVTHYKTPMPAWLYRRVVKDFNLEAIKTGLEFGFFPEEFMKMCRDQPEIIAPTVRGLMRRAGYSFTSPADLSSFATDLANDMALSRENGFTTTGLLPSKNMPVDTET